ncbi:hypothetical protein KBJ98_07495 [Flavobacterium sp. F-328]|uniref:histidine kinase n=1 Tax=Flavobacterium erciyesense TaxID=2825842 RepID=A0ABS5D3D0_9FLAO|nr:hypothetical protein [Flavobacterium erciyesense]MBQ0908543.1 hypothetical protein [Flavobacterium erciyesense]
MKYHKISHLFLLFTIIFISFSCQKEKVNPAFKKKKLAEIEKLFERGYSDFDEAKHDSAFYYFNKAKNLAEQIQDTSRIIYSLTWIATIEHNQGDYVGSEATSTEALPYLNGPRRFPYGETNIYAHIGSNYIATQDYKNAVYYLKKAINYKTDELFKGTIYNNIALAYKYQELYNKAESILRPLSSKKIIYQDSSLVATIKDNLGFVQYKLNKPNSLANMMESFKIRKAIKDNYGLLSSYNNLSLYHANSERKLAIAYAKKGYQTALKISHPDSVLEFLKLLIQTDPGKDLKKYADNYIRINDSLVGARQKAKNTFARIKYDSKREKDENLRLKNESIQQAQKIQKRNITIVLTIATMTLIGFFIIRKIRLNSKKEKVNAAYSTEVRLSQKLHDELANDLFQTIAFAEGQDLSTKENKETLIANLDIIYNQTRNISRENNSIETEASYLPNLKGLFFDFNTQQQHIITVGLDTIKWNSIENHTKITIFRIIQELLVNMKKHSNCTVAVFNFEIILNVLQISYRDNGLGLQNQTLQLKNGLSNLESRVQSIDGTATFNTMNESGFNAQFQIPI